MPKQLEIAGLLLTLDLAGTAVFAISGAAIGVKHRLDMFGVSWHLSQGTPGGCSATS